MREQERGRESKREGGRIRERGIAPINSTINHSIRERERERERES